MQYLENYLWPHFAAGESSFEHVMSMLVMVNEKFRENVPAWEGFRDGGDKFGDFFLAVLGLKDSLREKQVGALGKSKERRDKKGRRVSWLPVAGMLCCCRWFVKNCAAYTMQKDGPSGAKHLRWADPVVD